MVSAGSPPAEYSESRLGPYSPSLKVVRFEDVDEGVEAFVHEGVAALIGADDHGKPAMPDFVRGDPEQVLALVVNAVENNRPDIPCR